MLQRLFGQLTADLAVDLGTANTRIAARGAGIVVDEPSVVAVADRSNRALHGGLAVGHLARQLHARTGDSILVARPVLGGAIADDALCAVMLRAMLHKARPRRSYVRPRVVAGVPCRATPVDRRTLCQTLLRAGARHVVLIDQALAAAIGAELPVVEPVASMVCLVGAGTAQAAVVSAGEVVAAHTTHAAGCEAMDQAIVEHVKRHAKLGIAAESAEQLRIDLANLSGEADSQALEVSGVDLAAGFPRRALVSGRMVRDALIGPVDRLVELVMSTILDCSIELSSDLADRGMTLVGGGALTPGLAEYLSRATRVAVHVPDEPMAAVAAGMLTSLDHFERWRTVMEPSDAGV